MMLIFLYIVNLLGYGLGASPNEGGGNVRDLLAAAKASPRLGLGTSLKIPWACSPRPPHRFVSLSVLGVLPTLLITISSSSIDSL